MSAAADSSRRGEPRLPATPDPPGGTQATAPLLRAAS
jgi:hypothetical protein